MTHAATVSFSHASRIEPVDGPVDGPVEGSVEDAAGTSTAMSATFAGELHPGWTIGGKPNGGYLLAMLARGALGVTGLPHVLAAGAHYLFAPDPGPVTIVAETLRRGRSVGQARARLVQGERTCVEALFTVGTLDPDTEPYWSAGMPPIPAGAFADARRVPGTNPAGLAVAIMDQVDLRIDRETAGFGSGEPTGRGELTGWLALAEDEPFDPVSLLYAVDAFPPATFDIEVTGWVPTLELTCYVRALPAPGPVRVVHSAGMVSGQRVDERCWVWDSEGRVVAHATQLAAIRLG